MNEVVGDAVDVPGNADRIDESQDEHDQKRNPWKKVKHSKKVRAVQDPGGDWNDVPSGMREKSGIRLQTFGNRDGRESDRRLFVRRGFREHLRELGPGGAVTKTG